MRFTLPLSNHPPTHPSSLQGLKQIKKSPISARFVFIKPPSIQELERRLRGRGTEKEDSIQKRLARARIELDFAETPGIHDKTIVNNDLEIAYRELDEWVYGGQRQP